MIVYRVLRTIGRLALRWFYRDIEVVGSERLPDRGPVLLASNHPNALIDALVIGCTLRRPVTLTAKATLLDNPVTRVLMRMTGVVPLRRASDAAAAVAQGNNTPDPTRNDSAFVAVLDVLESGGIVLLVPEGKSHSDPSLAPLKTGLARIAVRAQDDRGLISLPIIPIGLTFERKWEPRSRVLVRIGPPIGIDDGMPNATDAVAEITRRIDIGLRDVTLNFRTSDEARRVLSISATVAEVLDDFRPLEAPDPPLAESIRLAQRISAIVPRLPDLTPALRTRIEQFLDRLWSFETILRENAIAASDVQMSTRTAPGVWFGVRELLIGALGGPFALWGRINHWVPLRMARAIALRLSRNADEPAMNTVVAGVVLVLAFYAAQTAVVAWQLGWLFAAAYAASLPVSATWDFRYADRLRRGVARVRTYFRLRRDRTLHQGLRNDLDWLRHEATILDTLVAEPAPQSTGPRSIPSIASV